MSSIIRFMRQPLSSMFRTVLRVSSSRAVPRKVAAEARIALSGLRRSCPRAAENISLRRSISVRRCSSCASCCF